MSAVLVREDDRKQTPTYFVGYFLASPKLNYLNTKKLVLTLVIANKK